MLRCVSLFHAFCSRGIVLRGSSRLPKKSQTCPLWVRSRHDTPDQRCPLLPQQQTSTTSGRMSAKCHVWTAPAMQGRNRTFQRAGRVQPCIRPLNAAAVAAGPDVIRGSGPNQKHALKSRMALVTGFPDRRSRPFRINVVITPAVREHTNATSTPADWRLLTLSQIEQLGRFYRSP